MHPPSDTTVQDYTSIHPGCYDGCVYSLASDSGATHWCTKPGGSSEPIKSSPCIDPITGLVWVGSHDHHIYALDIYVSDIFISTCIIELPFSLARPDLRIVMEDK